MKDFTERSSTPVSSPLSPTPVNDSALRLFELITTSWVSAAVGAAAELGIADAMSQTPTPVDQIAKRVGADTDALGRLLRACADLDLVAEPSTDVFTLTELGAALRTDSPNSMRGYARWLNSPAERSTMGRLADAVRTGGPVFEAVHGVPAWTYMREHPESADLFDQGMTDISSQITRPIVQDYDFTDSRLLIDVGGGKGRLLSLILENHPHLQGVLYDRPEVTRDALPALTTGTLAERCRVQSGDFLTSVPTGGDTYLIASVIHNWNDEDSIRILTHCRHAMAPKAASYSPRSSCPRNPHPPGPPSSWT